LYCANVNTSNEQKLRSILYDNNDKDTLLLYSIYEEGNAKHIWTACRGEIRQKKKKKAKPYHKRKREKRGTVDEKWEMRK